MVFPAPFLEDVFPSVCIFGIYVKYKVVILMWCWVFYSFPLVYMVLCLYGVVFTPTAVQQILVWWPLWQCSVGSGFLWLSGVCCASIWILGFHTPVLFEEHHGHFDWNRIDYKLLWEEWSSLQYWFCQSMNMGCLHILLSSLIAFFRDLKFSLWMSSQAGVGHWLWFFKAKVIQKAENSPIST